jgi:hypothetical protein
MIIRFSKSFAGSLIVLILRSVRGSLKMHRKGPQSNRVEQKLKNVFDVICQPFYDIKKSLRDGRI